MNLKTIMASGRDCHVTYCMSLCIGVSVISQAIKMGSSLVARDLADRRTWRTLGNMLGLPCGEMVGVF